MALQGITSLRYDVDYSQVTKAVTACGNLFATVSGLSKKSADEISKSFIDAQGKLALASKAASDAVTRVRRQQESDAKALSDKAAQDEINARQRAMAAMVAMHGKALQRYHEEKQREKELNEFRTKNALEYANVITRVNDTRKKGINAVRDAIFKIEQEIRQLRLKNVYELDEAEKKALDNKIKRLNAELQLHRSSEKQVTGGRTFTEQLEKNFSGPVVGQIAMMKGLFTQMRESANAPVSGGGMLGTLGAFAGKAVPFVAAGVAVGAALKGVVSVGMEFQDAMADLSAITGVTGPKLDSLGEKARALAMKYGIDAKDGVGAFKLALSALGPQVAQDEKSLNSMGTSIMTLAKAGGVDAQTATSALTNTINQFGYATADAKTQAAMMERTMNVLAAGSLQGAAEVQDLSMSMKEVGTVANLAGLSIEDTVGSLEILSQNGIKGAEAGTGLRNVLLSLSAGTDESKKVLQKLGLTFNDINPKTVGYEKSLATVRQAMDNMKNPTDKAIILKKLFGKENAATANILMQSTKTVDGHTSALNNMTKAVTGTNTANEQAKVKMATLSETWNRIQSAVKDFAITLFQTLQPAIETILGVFEDAMPVIKTVANVIGTSLSIAIKGLKITIDIMIFPLKTLWNIFKGIGEFLIDKLTPAFNWFKDKVLTPIGNAINTVGTAIMNAWEKVKTWVAEAVAWIEQKWKDAKVFINDISFGLLGESEEEQAADAYKARMQAQLDAALAAQREFAKKGTVVTQGGVTPPADTEDSILDKDDEKKKNPAEILKDDFAARKAILEQSLERENTSITRKLADRQITEEQARDMRLNAEKVHYNALAVLENLFYEKFKGIDKSESEKHALERDKAYTKLAELRREAMANEAKDLEEGLSKELSSLKGYYESSLIALDVAHKQGKFSEQEYQRLRQGIQGQSLQAEIDTYKDYAAQFKGVDEEKYKQALENLQQSENKLLQSRADFAAKEREDELKRQKDIDDRKLALMEEGIAKQLQAEELRYKREREMAKDNADALELIDKQHQKNIADITKTGEAEKAKEVGVYTDIVSGFFEKGYADRSKFLHESIAKDILHQEKGFFKQRGFLKKFLADQLKTFLTNKIAEALIHTQTEGTKTAASSAGTLARIGIAISEVASSLWAAGASAVSAIVNGVRWVFTTFPFPVSALIAAAVPGVVYGLYRGAKSLFKFARGGIVDRPQNFQFGSNGQFEGQRGEAGREAIIPLDSERGIQILRKTFSRSMPIIQTVPSYASYGNESFLSEKFDRLTEAFERKEFVSIFDQRKDRLSKNRYEIEHKRRRLN